MIESLLQPDRGQPARTIEIVAPADHDRWLAAQPPRVRVALAAQRFAGKPGSHAVYADEDVQAVVVAATPGPWTLGRLVETLPAGTYRTVGDLGSAALGWVLGQYRFDRYRAAEDSGARVLLTNDVAGVSSTPARAIAARRTWKRRRTRSPVGTVRPRRSRAAMPSRPAFH